jgi:hypothetical protein
MVNIFDIDSMHAIANARREGFLDEARQRRIASEVRLGRQRTPSRFRRAVGLGLINAGARLSGVNDGDMRRADAAA